MIQNDSTYSQNIVFLFSGQGSHYRGMGEKLYRTNPVFASSLEDSDACVQKLLGRSLIEELYEKKETPFDDLLITHPAIVAVELANLAVMRHLQIKPQYVCGNSLGEFSSAVASGIWTAEQAIEAAVEQAIAIVQCQEVTGGMLAVIDISSDTLEALLNTYNLYCASQNFPGHFTISGATSDLHDLEKELKILGITYLRLPVAYPFHSPLLKGKEAFMQYEYTNLAATAAPQGFVSGIYGKELEVIGQDYFWNAVSQPANFMNFVHYMEKKGPCLYIDLGASGTSATFVKYNLKAASNSMTHQIMTPFKREHIQMEALQKLLKQ